MPKTYHWHAGWSLPGCLPEMTPVCFDTEEDAESWLTSEMVNQEADDPYVYWCEPVFEDCEESA